MLQAETLETYRKATRVMEGTLPFLLAQSSCEKLLDERPPRGPIRHEKALDRILQDVFQGPFS